MRDMTPPPSQDDASASGDDQTTPEKKAPSEKRMTRRQRGWMSLRSSPLTRKIITWNLIALVFLFSGIVYLSSSRDALTFQRAASLVTEAELIADVIEVQLPTGAPVNFATGDGIDIGLTLENLDLRRGVEVFVYDRSKMLIANTEGRLSVTPDAGEPNRKTYLTDTFRWLWDAVASPIRDLPEADQTALSDKIIPVIDESFRDGTKFRNQSDNSGGTLYTVVTPVLQNGNAIGAVAVVTAAGEIDSLLRGERERVLQMFVIATVVSVGLSLVLASTIANPLADLAAAAEIGRDRNTRKMKPGRIRIPDLSDRPDEIGRLSAALRSMISALYNRIDGNEQFAADVAHEIKNPLASLRSAVGTLRMVKREDQRDKLLDVIDHDVRRLDRLVSDISDASRLDSELVKEEAERFDVLVTLTNLGQYLGEDAHSRGIDFITDFPDSPIMVHGLEARLAQVFVNLITNAVSFCEDGDAIRIWARKKGRRVLIVVEDTGPGIPEEALLRVFERFYSQRPDEHFGNNSGLGLAISKQIVEAHDGVIWAENIRPTEADITSEPLGARFVVGLPI
ncbi:sensor histidine kinase [Roseobacter litoralis]|uniref:sensor histidine kinase n=1 Tax=Roseobacter litoralis TaxID=42443 RepID=UPI0024942947|nr:sensor histidine kinase [Roseobacter litoralis]